MRRVLLTGASGFIGRHAVGALRERGYEVHAVSRQSPPGQGDGAAWHRADLLDPAATRGLVERVRPSHLLHFAWTVAPGEFWTSADNLRWVGASLELIRAFTENGGRRMVLSGSCAEYRWEGELLPEDAPTEPGSLYGVCKDSLHRIASRYAEQAGVEMAWGRIFFLYGPHEPPGRLVPSIAGALLRGETAPCTSGEQLRDFMHVQDVADAFAALLDSAVRGPVNVGSGEPVPVRRVAETVAELCGRPEMLAVGALPSRAGDPPRICADVGRLAAEVGWRPRLSLAAGLRQSVEWWKSNLEHKDHD